jgi:hypothetical protein
MDLRMTKTFCDILMLGAVVAAAGSVAGLWLPLGAALFLFALAVCRICWIEDNIHHDLLTADRIPPGYRACRTRRSAFLGAAPADPGADPDCPRRLAAEMRLQAHALGAFAWAIVAGMLLKAGVPLTFVAGAAALFMALRHADYLAYGTALLATGRSLPDRLIAGRGPLTRLAVIPHRPD